MSEREQTPSSDPHSVVFERSRLDALYNISRSERHAALLELLPDLREFASKPPESRDEDHPYFRTLNSAALLMIAMDEPDLLMSVFGSMTISPKTCRRMSPHDLAMEYSNALDLKDDPEKKFRYLTTVHDAFGAFADTDAQLGGIYLARGDIRSAYDHIGRLPDEPYRELMDPRPELKLLFRLRDTLTSWSTGGELYPEKHMGNFLDRVQEEFSQRPEGPEFVSDVSQTAAVNILTSFAQSPEIVKKTLTLFPLSKESLSKAVLVLKDSAAPEVSVLIGLRCLESDLESAGVELTRSMYEPEFLRIEEGIGMPEESPRAWIVEDALRNLHQLIIKHGVLHDHIAPKIRACMLRAVARYPDSRIIFEKGRIFDAINPETIDEYLPLIEQHASPDVYIYAGNVLSEGKRYDEAYELYEKAAMISGKGDSGAALDIAFRHALALGKIDAARNIVYRFIRDFGISVQYMRLLLGTYIDSQIPEKDFELCIQSSRSDESLLEELHASVGLKKYGFSHHQESQVIALRRTVILLDPTSGDGDIKLAGAKVSDRPNTLMDALDLAKKHGLLEFSLKSGSRYSPIDYKEIRAKTLVELIATYDMMKKDFFGSLYSTDDAVKAMTEYRRYSESIRSWLNTLPDKAVRIRISKMFPSAPAMVTLKTRSRIDGKEHTWGKEYPLEDCISYPDYVNRYFDPARVRDRSLLKTSVF